VDQVIFNSPISSEKADRLVQMLELPANGRVFDAGCGTGELLLRIVAQHRIHGIGVDQDQGNITTAQANVATRGIASRCEFQAIDVNQFEADPGAFDLAICIGSTHAFGLGESAYPNAIKRLTQLVRPGGQILLGETYWKQPPAAEYLQLIGQPVGIYRDHAENISFAEKHGLVTQYSTTSDDNEWNDFESGHFEKVHREAETNPDDRALAAKLIRARIWLDGYQRWGRSTMGFGIYLLRAPHRIT
jgi:cyclopropane fatty-acyl-phospholipid synthase-like methyltransferase